MRLLISFAALFLSVLMLQLSSGGLGPLDALSGLSLDFTTEEIGLLGSAHFVGFFLGCWGAPRMMGSVGHSRAFAVFTATGAIGMLAHMMWVAPLPWAGMRIASGFCVAGCYTVIEAWLQAKVTNSTRGRTISVYRVVDMSGSLAAQLMIGILEPAAYVSYNLLAMLCCAALLPLALTRSPQPETPDAPRLKPKLALDCSPLAVAAVVVAAVSSASFRMIGPVYGRDVGLDAAQIGTFLAAFVLGGALAQFPAGALADRFDRRWVLVWLSVASVLSSALTAGLRGFGPEAAFVGAFVFGATTFPIYSVATAHAHDFARSDQRVELSAALMFFFAAGAIASPLLGSALMSRFGPGSMFAMIAVAHVFLVVFGLGRMRARPTSGERTPYVYAPRTSFTIGRLLGRQRDRK